MEARKIQNKLQLQIKRRWQAVSLVTVLFFLGLMSLSTLEISWALDNSNTNLAQNVTAGTLDIDSVPASLAFNNGTPGQTTTANTTTSGIVVNDTRGSQVGWNITGFLNTNFYKITDANIQMPINDGGTLRLYWGANNGAGGTTITNVTGESGDAVGGANGSFNGIESGSYRTLMTDNTGTYNGAGAYNMTNLKFNYQISPTASVADYKTNLRLTIA